MKNNKLVIIWSDNTKKLPIEVWVDNKLVWEAREPPLLKDCSQIKSKEKKDGK